MGDYRRVVFEEALAESNLSQADIIESLDELIHEAHSEEAAACNNAGIESQLDYLIDVWGFTIPEILEKL